METELLSVDDITRLLRISRGTAQKWCREKKLPAAKIGKEYRVRKEDLDRWYEGKLLEHVIAVR
ncbi:helix-turn-helix domain-containing protein [Chloroflexota bacterium]